MYGLHKLAVFIAITTTRRVSIEVSPVLSFQVLVKDDASFNVVNELGLDKLVAVRESELTQSSSATTTTGTTTTTTSTTKPIVSTTVASQLGLSTKVTVSLSEVNVYVIPESEKGQSAATFWLSR